MQQSTSPVMRWSTSIIEFGWLAAIFCIPSFFNLLSSRHFEPDKALAFRFIVFVLSTFVVINIIESRRTHPTPPRMWWQHYKNYPLMIAIMSYCGIFVLSTITSIVPEVSFWGSYQRLQGTYTNISYVVLALIMLRYITHRAQVWRVVSMILLGSIVPTLYGYVQHFEMDPLPWKGDVITRVASTSGNSIFIAAYLILVVPFALAHAIHHWQIARTQPAEEHPKSWLWLSGHMFNIGAVVAVIFGGMQMSGVIRSIDTMYWWIYPSAIISGFSVALLITATLHQQPRFNPVWVTPAVVITLYTTICQIIGISASESLMQPDLTRFGANWNWWLWTATLFAWIGVTAYIKAPYAINTLKTQAYAIAAASACLAIANWVTIILSQSRGPWIGGAVGLFLFFVLFAVHQIRTNPHYATTAKRILIVTMVGFVSLFGFLLVFNFADVPALRQFREMPYIGRMGKLFDISPGTTGDVRMKIWFGDQYGSGAVGLILSNPIRTIIGWGPESMFAAYTPFYPPSLANIESRSATPDRSHQAFLDELVNKGILGLLSYLAVISLALRIAWVQLGKSAQSADDLLLIAIISLLASHLVEGLTGIPVVNSLMLQWIAIALIIYLHNPLPQQHTNETTPTPAPVQSAKGNKSIRAKVTPAIVHTESPLPVMLGYIAIVAIGVGVAWSSNINNMYADMRFQQGQTYNSSAIATNNSDQQIIALAHYLSAATLSPSQDYYYLNIGRSLLNIADSRRRQNNALESTHVVDFRGLLIQQDPRDLKQFMAPLSARDITRYAEESLLRANQLYPRNKDHSANLARLYLFWFNRIEQDPALLETATNWFSQSVQVAPNDVSIINEYAGSLISYANAIRETDSVKANSLLNRAEDLLKQSQQRDQRYRNTTVRLGDLALAKGDYQTALRFYDQALTLNPRALDNQITTIISQHAPNTASHPFLRNLRDVYARVRPADDTVILAVMGLISSRINDNDDAIRAFAQLTELQPNNIEAQQNYTLVLSTAMQYAEAYRASERLFTLAQQSGYPQSALDVYAGLREYLNQKATP
ncbi:MAG: O-antigen ligase family protein [Chloroflexota bacterium]|jgi:tetratricopeptide (TPR) repeat protein